ncbi:hypothetical protein G3N58_15120 [Paraburkholderia sp. Ac-20342]|uniref:hypothetical protein n=1 Tax=Paraburkholderia sp. Ac-20342 TaxID=2703889 RepID=UPI00197E8D47|nr:hypothetical protein [Paraburkholderia sp. Ac-20342]MBN3848151.1 hypothetical protein [Paraburkholderia sp. Ac-20342]
MAKVTFIGDPKGADNTPSVEHKGTVFERGITLTVPDFIASKLVNNSHFKVTGYKGAAPDPESGDEKQPASDTCTREQFNAAMGKLESEMNAARASALADLSAQKDSAAAAALDSALAAAKSESDAKIATMQAEIDRLTALVPPQPPKA